MGSLLRRDFDTLPQFFPHKKINTAMLTPFSVFYSSSLISHDSISLRWLLLNKSHYIPFTFWLHVKSGELTSGFLHQLRLWSLWARSGTLPRVLYQAYLEQSSLSLPLPLIKLLQDGELPHFGHRFSLFANLNLLSHVGRAWNDQDYPPTPVS